MGGVVFSVVGDCCRGFSRVDGRGEFCGWGCFVCYMVFMVVCMVKGGWWGYVILDFVCGWVGVTEDFLVGRYMGGVIFVVVFLVVV